MWAHCAKKKFLFSPIARQKRTHSEGCQARRVLDWFTQRGFVNINDAITRCSSKTTKNAESFCSAPPNEPKYNGMSTVMVISPVDEKKAKRDSSSGVYEASFYWRFSRTHIHWRCLVAGETSGWRTVHNREEFKSRVFTILRFHGFHPPDRAHWQLDAFWFSRVCRRSSAHFHSFPFEISLRRGTFEWSRIKFKCIVPKCDEKSSTCDEFRECVKRWLNTTILCCWFVSSVRRLARC